MAIVVSTSLITKNGEFDVKYHRTEYGDGLSITKGVYMEGTPLLRVHSSCLFSESLQSITCDCASQLHESLRMIAEEMSGVVIYMFEEGRGAGLIKKMEAIEIEQKEKVDTAEAFRRLNLPPDLRDYRAALQILEDISISKFLRLITNNPDKKTVLENAGYRVIDIVGLKLDLSESARDYLRMKKEKLGHTYVNID